jgi:hypothetical protein
MKHSLLSGAVLASLLAISSTATAAVIASESFETPVLASPSYEYGPDESALSLPPGATAVIANFTFKGFSGIMTNGTGLFPDTPYGNQVAFLQSYHSGGSEIDWALTGLIPGQLYALFFADVSSSVLGATPLDVSAFGGAFVHYNPGASFVTETLDFTPSTASGSIDFVGDLEGPNSLSAIDNLTVSSLSAVPEPAAWLMMIAGLGMAGGALRSSGRNSRNLAGGV